MCPIMKTVSFEDFLSPVPTSMSSVALQWGSIVPLIYILLVFLSRLIVRELELSDKGVLRHGFLTGVLGVFYGFCCDWNQASLGYSMILMNGCVTLFGWILAVNTYYVFIRGPKYRHQSLRGRNVIVTGANAGIGYETAKQLAELGAHVILACRTASKAKKAVQEIQRHYPSAALTCLSLDLSQLESIQKFVHAFEKLNLPLHVLINNAGLVQQGWVMTKDGIEMTMASNHFGHFRLTHDLLPHFCDPQMARIVNVGSSMHKWVWNISDLMTDLMVERNYGLFKAYNLSKLANIVFTHELSRRLEDQKIPIQVNCVHPGFVMSEITSNLPLVLQLVYRLVLPILPLFSKTCAEGAYPSIFAAISPTMKGITGQYVHNGTIHPHSGQDRDIIESFWNQSCHVMHLPSLDWPKGPSSSTYHAQNS